MTHSKAWKRGCSNLKMVVVMMGVDSVPMEMIMQREKVFVVVPGADRLQLAPPTETASYLETHLCQHRLTILQLRQHLLQLHPYRRR